MRNLLKALCIGLCVLGLAVPSAMAAKQIKVSILQPEGDPMPRALRDAFKTTIESKSGGKYKVDIYAGAAMGGADTVFQGVQYGLLHFGVDTTSNLSPVAEELSILDMPYLFPTLEDVNHVFGFGTERSQAGKNLIGYLDKTGAKTMAIMLTTFRQLYTSKPVNTLEEARGLKIRTTASKSHILSIQSLGMNPTPMAAAEMLTGIKQGVVAGADVDLPSVITYRFCDVTKNVLMTDHIAVLYVMFTSQSFWNALSPEDRIIFEEAITNFQKTARDYIDQAAKDAVKEAQQTYGVVYNTMPPEEKERWIKQGQSAYPKLSPHLQKVAKDIQDTVAARKK